MNISESISLNATLAESLVFGNTSQNVQGQELPTFSFANGTGGGQVDRRYETGPVTLAAAATLTLVLSALTDALGRPASMARVRKLLLWVTSRADADYLTVGGAPTHPWAAVPTFTAKDLRLVVDASTAGLVVTSGSSDQLLITNSGAAAITFRLDLSGCSV